MKETRAHEGLGIVDNSLKELWLEIGGSCHLRCSYCFAESGGIDTSVENLPLESIVKTLEEFKEMGGERIGIPGAGEPFHPKNREALFRILEYANSSGLKTTVFTAGDLLTEEILQKIDSYRNTTLLIKYNSSDPEIQDRLVNSKGYTQRRAEALQRMIARGYNDGQRLGIVTSIFKENQKEMPSILRYARQNNLIFDADTVLPRGRGESCQVQIGNEEVRKVIRGLQKVDKEEFGIEWDITGSYIASPPCTRFSNHLYVDKTGKVHPCVGSQGVELGDLKEQNLIEIWESPICKIIRAHNYQGRCTTCRNYQEKKCFSCLGRATQNLSTDSLAKKGYVETTGCFGFKE